MPEKPRGYFSSLVPGQGACFLKYMKAEANRTGGLKNGKGLIFWTSAGEPFLVVPNDLRK